MPTKNEELQERKDSILAIAINRYIDTVSPVSSKIIADEISLDLSSATIRNTLAELEEEGYLTHPHTSAGRVPTHKGYRYFVDNLMNEIIFLEEEKKRIKSEYQKQSLELESLLEKTSQDLSTLTRYTSIVSVDGWGTKIFCQGTSYVVEYPDYQDVQKIKNILEALDEKKSLLEIINRDLESKVGIFIGQEIALSEMSHCSLVVSSYKLKQGPSGRIAILGPARMHYDRVISTLEYFSNLMEEIV